MLLLPKKVGPFTLMRRLGADGATESYTAILEDPAGKQVVARRIEPWLLEDPQKRTDLVNRVRDLEAVQHASLISTLDYVTVEGQHYIISDWVDGVSLRQLVFWCMTHREAIPHNIYLNIAARVCNGLEALHSRPGAVSGSEHVLHLGMSPECVILRPDGGVTVGVYGLVRRPQVSSAGATAGVHRVEYLSPEQTHPDQGLSPATDIFSLGATLYELLTLKPLFKAGSRLQTMHRIRRAEVTTQLLEVKELLPGLDKVLYRALSLNPRHRYQRAFVLREDLRGLMANYSFADIDDATQDFLAPLMQAKLVGDTDEVMPRIGPDGPSESTDALLENSLQNLELPPGFFQDQAGTDDTASSLSAQDFDIDALKGTELDPASLDAPSLPPIARQGFPDSDTGALLRRANDADPEGPITDVDELRQVPGAGTPTPRQRTQAPPAPAAEAGLEPDGHTEELPDEPDITDVPEPAGLAPVGAPPADDATGMLQRMPTPRDLEQQLAAPLPLDDFDQGPPTQPVVLEEPEPTSPLPEEPVAQTEPDAGAPLDEHTRPSTTMPDGSPLLEAPVPDSDTIPSVPPASMSEDEDGDEQDPAAALAGPGALGKPRSRKTPAPGPRRAVLTEGGAPITASELKKMEADPEPSADDFSDLDWQPNRGMGPIGIAVGAAAFFAVFGVACFGLGAANYFSSSPASVAAADAGGDGQMVAATAPDDEEADEPVEDDDNADAVAAVAVDQPAPAPRLKSRPTPEPRPAAARVAPEPRPEPVPPRPAPVQPRPEPPAPVVAPPPPPAPEPVAPPPPAPVAPPPRPVLEPESAMVPDRFEDDAVALADLATDEPEPLPVDSSDFAEMSLTAQNGALSPEERLYLEEIPEDDPDYTRARVLLYEDAKARDDVGARRRQLDAMMVLPENNYRPEYLVEEAQIALLDRDYETALARAELAERHWARLPQELIFSRRAAIFEIEAAALTGLFYASDGEDLDALERAIRVWEKYRRHVQTRQRGDLQQHADGQIAKLSDMRERLQ